jgi:putative transposase
MWVADFTYLRCWEGVVFFSFVIDAYSRRIVGWQFASQAFGHVLDDHQVLASIGTVGDALDNAMAESFIDSFKTELIADRV